MKSLHSLARRLRNGLAGGSKFQTRAFTIPRNWSNAELRKYGAMLAGSAVNVSAWEDRDKEGGFYKEYFPTASSYHITNFGTDQGSIQGREDEIFLDLEASLSSELEQRFATVFNHTTLEHVWDFRTAFANICALSSDIVIIVLPWLQPIHANYGDYWRFSPQAVVRMFEEQDFTTLHLTWNEQPRASVYIFAIASRKPDDWSHAFPHPIRSSDAGFLELPANFAGSNAF